MTTIYDVAEVAGVSISTVSHVLNRTRPVREETRTRVLAAMQKLEYRPSSLARAMVRQKTRTIGLIVPDNVNPFFAELARGIENYGFDAGYSVMLCNSDQSAEKEVAYLDMLISKRVDGVIYMTSDAAEERLAPLRSQMIPVVTFDRDFPGVHTVMLENHRGGFTATEHLINLGHRRIACVAGNYSTSHSQDRVSGYRDALEQNGLVYDPALVLIGDWSLASGKSAALHFMRMAQPPTAIFACNDIMAIGAISGLHTLGLAVPDDISLVGFDDISVSAYTVPALTTVATPVRELGEMMCQMLVDTIGGVIDGTAIRRTLSGKLVVRESTAPPHRR
jgi:LacI family transcriptional regulator